MREYLCVFNLKTRPIYSPNKHIPPFSSSAPPALLSCGNTAVFLRMTSKPEPLSEYSGLLTLKVANNSRYRKSPLEFEARSIASAVRVIPTSTKSWNCQQIIANKEPLPLILKMAFTENCPRSVLSSSCTKSFRYYYREAQNHLGMPVLRRTKQLRPRQNQNGRIITFFTDVLRSLFSKDCDWKGAIVSKCFFKSSTHAKSRFMRIYLSIQYGAKK